MAGPRKVRIFRDPKKSPNWYVEWRDLQGHRHCESCGPQRRDAQERADQITEELRVQREEAKRLAQTARQSAAYDETTLSAASSCDGTALHLQGLLRLAQLVVPITLRLEVPSVLVTAFRQLLREADEQ
ncbi:MAG TPA: hypothetical protein VKD72_19240 [Gemmataceae bacterium]|nr:hypothetical protein [Gemmataceae bacterium]